MQERSGTLISLHVTGQLQIVETDTIWLTKKNSKIAFKGQSQTTVSPNSAKSGTV